MRRGHWAGLRWSSFTDRVRCRLCRCVITIAGAIAAANVGGITTVAKGVDVNRHAHRRAHAHTQPLTRVWLRSNSTAIFDDAIATAQNADIVVLVLGNDRTQVVVSAVSTASGVMRLR